MGSSLIPRDKQRLPLKKHMPGNDTIIRANDRGYQEAYEKFAKVLHWK